MLRALEKDALCKRRLDSVLDMGSGTGFLGIVIARNCPSIARLDMSDWLLTPLVYSLMNWEVNCHSKEYVEINAHLGLFGSWLKPGQELYDVLVCNPPYLPILKGFEGLGLESTIAGTELLVYLIRNSNKLAKRTYVNYSSIAKPEADMAAGVAGKLMLIPGDAGWDSPFRIYVVKDKPEYIDRLIEERGLIIKEDRLHKYWHHIQTYCIG